MTLPGRGFPESFTHPACGPSQLDPAHLAVRWRPGVSDDAKQVLIAGLGLVSASTGDDGRRPAVVVNRTDALWWVQRADFAAVDAETLDALQASDLVEWYCPAYRAPVTSPAAQLGNVALFAVNPTRAYVPSEAAPSVSASPDPSRSTRIPGYVAMTVTSGTSLSLTMSAAATASTRPVRLETVPFVSPACTQVATEFTPDDPMFADQWGLQRIEVPSAWELVRGSCDVTIAVIDEGVELAHPDLDVHPQSWNASTDTPNGGPTGNHGTACAGIIGARLDNALGVAGIAGGSQVMAIATATWADVDIAEGLYFAVDNGARVVSMSFGVYPQWGVWDFDLVRDALQYAYDKGLLLVAAAGNENAAVARFPGSDSRTLCVGGSNRNDERKRVGDSSSEPFWGASYGPDVDVVAPCLEIPTTDRLGAAGYSADDYFDRFNGTSAATPHVAGLGALVFSLRPDLDNVQVRRIIEKTCDKISPGTYTYEHVATKPSGTWHQEVGYGRVNAMSALTEATNTP